MQIGIDLGGSHVGVAVISENGKVAAKKEQDFIIKGNEPIDELIRDTIVSLISHVLKEVGAPLCVIHKIGIACPGEVKNGVVKNLYNLGLKEFPIKQMLEEYYQVETTIRNDAKCAGLAEKKYGSLQYYEDSVFLCIGTGIGGATFLNGKLLKPNRNAGSEYGHMIIQKDGLPCKCGNKGCFESYCSMRALKENIKRILQLPEETTSQEILEEMKRNRNHPELEQYIDSYIEYFMIGISNIVRIIEPQAISLGGSFVYFKEILYHKLLEKLEQHRYSFETPKVILATLGNDAGMIGAITEE